MGAILTTGSLFSMSAHAQPKQTLCNPSKSDNGYGAGHYKGAFYSWFELASDNTESNCTNKITFIGDHKRHFRINWRMPRSWSEDSIGGMGWEKGKVNRKIAYNISQLKSNSPRQKALVAVYGWSCSKTKNRSISQEYYIVDSWAGPGKFVPWDENANDGNGSPATPLGSVSANGATYDFYKVRRNGAQFCFSGNSRSFDQFWSVRRTKNKTGRSNTIDFKPHSNKWDNRGFKPKGLSNGYQILAVEVFGDANLNHSGTIDVKTWERR